MAVEADAERTALLEELVRLLYFRRSECIEPRRVISDCGSETAGINLETPNSPGLTPLGTGAVKPQPFS